MMSARGYAAIGLHRPRDAKNMGEVLRAAGCYGASLVAVAGRRFEHTRTDTQKAWRHMPVIEAADLVSVVPFGCAPVAVEFIATARPLPAYTHPERAFYVFGPEDGSLPEALLAQCQDVICIPTHFCMNLAATVNVVLYDRMVKRARNQTLEATA